MTGCSASLISLLLYVMSQWYRIRLGWTDTGMIPPTSSWPRVSYEIYGYDWNTNSHIRGGVHTLLYATSPTESDETYRTRNRIVRIGYTRVRCLFNGYLSPPGDASMINNTMKTRDNIIKMTTIPPQQEGRLELYPRRNKQPAGFSYERNMENKDRGLTSPSGCTPVDVAPC